MRLVTGAYRRTLRIERACRRNELRRTLPNSDTMNARNLRTADYPEAARRRLGEAVEKARRAAGFRWRTQFIRAHGDIGITSLNLVETYKPLVGAAVLQAIGRALGQYFPGRWNEDTPKAILEGADPPSLDPLPVDLQSSPVFTASVHDPEFWEALRNEVPKWRYDELWEMYLQVKRRTPPSDDHPQ